MLLNLQSQLRQYEIDLDSLDEQLSATSLSKEHGEAFSRRRSQLLRDIEDKFAKYSKSCKLIDIYTTPVYMN